MNTFSHIKLLAVLAALLLTLSFATCKYSTHDVAPIPADVKTFRVNYLENKARYVNPQLMPQVTEKLRQKIIGQTRLKETNNDDAHYDISGYLSDYSISTTGISNNVSSTNRLSVTFHLVFKNTLDNTKNFEADISNNYDFNGSETLQQAESEKYDQIVKDLTDGIFNKIFSNW
ncbi:MAG TPA: LPS assembly lipoprotein LptE [Chitinophagaceae bacterium]|nr:LPS assembly lipoprotein LptE [Chitinophagaceae bacterium]